MGEPSSYDDPQDVAPQYNGGTFFMQCVSNTLLVALRDNIGYRQLSPRNMTVSCLIMFGLGYAESTMRDASAMMRSDGIMMIVFAVAISLGAAAQRRKARPWIQRAHGYIHSLSRGNSRWMPAFRFFRISEPIGQRLIEPLVMGFLGACSVTNGYVLVGFWLAFSAACLYAMEATVLKTERIELMGLRDNRSDAQRLHTMDNATPENAHAQTSTDALSDHGRTAAISPELSRLQAVKTRTSLFSRRK